MKKFIYNGIYYPVIGCSATCFEGRNNKVAWSKKLGGYIGLFSWLPYIGIRCRVSNPDKPYKQFVIDAIRNNENMVISKWYFDEDYKDQGYMWIVNTISGKYIGNIHDAYVISDMTAFTTVPSGSSIQVAYDKKTKTAYGWSHRARCGFKVGDKLFEENFEDENTPYSQHGKKTIKSYADQMKAAANFAKYVS